MWNTLVEYQFKSHSNDRQSMSISCPTKSNSKINRNNQRRTFPCIHGYSALRFSFSSVNSIFSLGELSQFFVSKSPFDPTSKTGKFSVSISGPSTVFLDANETDYGYEVNTNQISSRIRTISLV